MKQHNHHVQAWVRDRVRVLEMLAECARIQTILDAREAKRTEMFEWNMTDMRGKKIVIRSL